MILLYPRPTSVRVDLPAIKYKFTCVWSAKERCAHRRKSTTHSQARHSLFPAVDTIIEPFPALRLTVFVVDVVACRKFCRAPRSCRPSLRLSPNAGRSSRVDVKNHPTMLLCSIFRKRILALAGLQEKRVCKFLVVEAAAKGVSSRTVQEVQDSQPTFPHLRHGATPLLEPNMFEDLCTVARPLNYSGSMQWTTTATTFAV